MNFTFEGFDPGSTGVDISFSSLPTSTSIVKAGAALGIPQPIMATHHVVSTTDETNPLDRFDIAIDANFLYIVWEEKNASGALVVWSMVVKLSDGTPQLLPTLVTTAAGLGSTGRRPTVAVDIRHSSTTTEAPFDVAYMDAIPAGNVIWRQWNPAGGAFLPAASIPHAIAGTADTWSDPTHARILDASQAGVTPSTANQRGVYLIADTHVDINQKQKGITGLLGLSLFLDRIVSGLAQTPVEYCDGVLNNSHPGPIDLPNPPNSNLYPVVDEPLWSFTNPYEGANAGSTNPAVNFTEFHSLYRLDRSSVCTSANGEDPLLIIRTSVVATAFCVSEANGTTFLDDPVANANGITQFCGAVNQMGIHVHWISSSDHFYARDRREFDQDIEENTLMTETCIVHSPCAFTKSYLVLYSDPSTSGASGYTGSGYLSITNGAKLAINPSGGGGDFIDLGAFAINFDGTAGDIIEIDANDQMDFYGNAHSGISGAGEFKITGSGETMESSSYGNWPVDISSPAKLNIHGGTNFEVGVSGNSDYFTCSDAIIHFKFETNIVTGTGSAAGEMTLNDHSGFTKCWIYSDEADESHSPTAIRIGANGYAASGTGNADYNASSPTFATDTFEQCVFYGGTGEYPATMEISDPNVAPNELLVDNGWVGGWSFTGGNFLYWPIVFTNVTFYQVIQNGLDINYSSTPPQANTKLYSLLVDGCGFQGYGDFTHFPNPDGIKVENAPDIGMDDGLRESITITGNTFEATNYFEPAGGVEAAIHFSNTTGDIGYNQIYGVKHQRGIWNESSTETSHPNTWSFICSNTISALTNAAAAGISTDHYTGYAKLNTVSDCALGHVSGSFDAGHIVFSSYNGNSGAGLASSSSSAMDLTGVHHTGGGDVAAFDTISNNGGGSQITLAGTSVVFLGQAGPGSGSWSVFGENDIEKGSASSPTLLSSSETINPSLGNVDNNFWGNSSIQPESVSPNGSNWNTSALSEVTASNIDYTATNHLSSAPFITGISCSEGLFTKQIGPIPLSDIHYDTSSRCDNVLRQGALLQNDGQWEPSYDSLALFLQICSYDSNSQIGAQPWRAFVTINGSASALLSQRGFGAKYLAFLKQVLYNNPDTLWYCNDVEAMLTAEQSNEAAQLAELKYIIDSRKCQGFTDWQTYYNAASHWMHQAWLDSIVLDYERDSIYGGYQWWVDSMVNKDTLTNPYDSTIPSLEQEDLQILLGPQNIVQGPSSPVASPALVSARSVG